MDNPLVRKMELRDLSKMHTAFLKAFSDYPLPFNFTKEEFYKKFVEKLNINFDLSPAAFYNRRIIAFIFTSVACYDGKLTAYNGGTGVVPDFRGQRLTSRLYKFIFPELKRNHVDQCVLEVLTTNHRAIRVYEEIGFEKSRYFNCFKLTSSPRLKKALMADVSLSVCAEPDWDLFNSFSDTNTSFLDSQSLLQRNLKNEMIITASHSGETIGYVVYQGNGRISRIGVDHKFRNQGVGSALVNYAFRDCHRGELTVINVSKEDKSIIQFFKDLGFVNEVDQYELKLVL